jgi:hypothetical protein
MGSRNCPGPFSFEPYRPLRIEIETIRQKQKRKKKRKEKANLSSQPQSSFNGTDLKF